MIIAFSGIDGSGKTTCARSVSDYFESRNMPVKYSHIVRDSFYHKILHRLIGRVSRSAQNSLENSLRTKNAGAAVFISRWIKKAALFINLLYFNLRYMRYRNNLRRSIVTDRYFYDDIVQSMYLGITGKMFLSIYEKLIVRPDLVFFLRSEPMAAYARKQEYNREYFIKKKGLYDDIYGRIPNITIQESSISSIKEIVMSHLERLIEKHV